jgi:uncharacterized protein (DUF433 family)
LAVLPLGRIKGTRIWGSLILDMLSDGSSFQLIMEELLRLSKEDILAAIDEAWRPQK